MCMFWWQESQITKDGETNYAANCNSYCLCGSSESIYQVYFMLEQTNKNIRCKLTCNGIVVQVGDSLFPWWKG